jgi:hypothetical protein
MIMVKTDVVIAILFNNVILFEVLGLVLIEIEQFISFSPFGG